MNDRFRPFTLVYYMVLLIAALWAMNKWIMIPLMGWTAGHVLIGHIMIMWLAGLFVICGAAVLLTKAITK